MYFRGPHVPPARGVQEPETPAPAAPAPPVAPAAATMPRALEVLVGFGKVGKWKRFLKKNEQ